jgi:acyl-CoA thioester hydrolase
MRTELFGARDMTALSGHSNRLIRCAFGFNICSRAAGRFRYPDNMQPVETRLRVRYAETDQMGVVYYANYLIWMEVGRVEFCRSSGIRYREVEAEGFLLAVAESNCRYVSPARYDDEVVVSTTLGDPSPRMPRFDYVIVDAATGRKLAEGYTKHIWCGPDFRPKRLPEKYWQAFGVDREKSN